MTSTPRYQTGAQLAGDAAVSPVLLARVGKIKPVRFKIFRRNPSGVRIINQWTVDAIYIPIGE